MFLKAEAGMRCSLGGLEFRRVLSEAGGGCVSGWVRGGGGCVGLGEGGGGGFL